ncbi:hypothetical protein [Microlunatus flavus]|uniref:Uncharacterized protein n=1 Tax=Microlunatus flavus TaxID=1036181 RepID=A0A1H8Z7I4_9ACTN|nr:hypothetical protein [Microlunatus flavus]SEP59568.1 hypothetical protein SAMN05421756_101103 [Microlunatus flavus]
MAPLRTQAKLHHHRRGLMGPLGFTVRRLCAHVQQGDHHGRIAVLLSRPGRAALCASDRRWGRALVDSARRSGVWLAPLHLANDEVLGPLTGDDLLVPRGR